ncbi:MAG TPA: TIGR02679 family protein [Ktedonobacteraceae bacterium]|jgi:uncharacterized protein (TIGR02679 family)
MSLPGSPADHPSDVLRAADFFGQSIWTRLLNAIYEKYIAQGRAGGQVVLRACTSEERREVARFLGKRLSAGETLVVRLADFQQALDASGFPCELGELLAALYPERPQVTRPDRRRQRAQAQQRFYEALSSLGQNPPAGAGERWLLTGAHGREYLFLHHKNDEPVLQEQVVQATRQVIAALNQLPIPPAYERLALFAQRVGGDPHLLDTPSFTGRLFLFALQDLPALNRPQDAAGTTDAQEPEDQTPLPPGELVEEEGFSPRAQNRQRLLLYYKAGLLTDTISSTVAVFQLAHAEDARGVSDPLVASAGARVLVLPLRQLLSWQRLVPASQQVYVFENPQVFETVIDEIQQRISPAHNTWSWPTLVCTSGWPGVAAIRLLDLLTRTHPQTLLYYSGDFDLAGLRIAAYLQECYRPHLRLWRLDPQAYQAALHHQGTALTSHELAALRTLPDAFAPLATAMQARGTKAYQEGITRLLLQDIMATAHP